MFVVIVHWIGAALCMGLSLLLGKLKKPVASLICWIIACVFALLLVWLGCEFSTSYTLMYMLVNLFLCTLSEVLARSGHFLHFQGREVQDFDAIHGLLFASGLVFAPPAVFIYAQGDDKLGRCIVFSLIVGTLAAAVTIFLEHRRRGVMSKGRVVRIWLSVCASLFTLNCGLRSPMLLFYGVGLILMTTARLMEDHWEQTRAMLYFMGLIFASIFAVLPML